MRKVEQKVLRYLQERGWDNLKPADLAKSVAIEAGELLELFQWENLPLTEVKKDKEKVAKIRKELADVFIYLFDIAVLLGLDTESLIDEKLEHITKKYPAELMRKSSKKAGSRSDSAYWKIKDEYRRKGL